MTKSFGSEHQLTFEWIDLLNPSQEELGEVAAKYNLHRSLVEDSLQPEHLPKYEMIGDIHFLILRVYSYLANHQSDTIQELTDKIAIFIDDKFIISIHRDEYPFLQQIGEEDLQAGRCHTPFDVLQHIILQTFDTFEKPLNQLSSAIESFEPKIFLERNMPDLLEDLYYIKRQAYAINRVLNLSKGILEHLHGKIPNPDLNNLKDAMLSLYTDSEHVMDHANTLLNTYISMTSQRTNEVVKVLTIFSVFFMPLTFIVGIYGMNFDVMPELRWHFGYPAVGLLMVVVTLVIYQWFKRKGWL